MSTIIITIQSTDDVTLTDGPILTPSANKRDRRSAVARLENILARASAGFGTPKVQVVTAQSTSGGTKGTAVLTITAGNAVAAETVTVAGVVFTWAAAANVTDTPSAPLTVAIGADNTASATNLTAAMNLNPTVSGLGVATSALGVVTWTENIPGGACAFGTVSDTMANGSWGNSALTGGVSPTFQGAAYYSLDNP